MLSETPRGRRVTTPASIPSAHAGKFGTTSRPATPISLAGMGEDVDADETTDVEVAAETAANPLSAYAVAEIAVADRSLIERALAGESLKGGRLG